jgi:methyl coenzyme M reductase subunit C
MKHLSFTTFNICIVFFLFSSAALHAQQVQPTQPATDDDVVKITTKLVQFDTVVTDKGGNQVRDLNIADF